jgi:hypothetical protein
MRIKQTKPRRATNGPDDIANSFLSCSSTPQADFQTDLSGIKMELRPTAYSAFRSK